MGEIPTRQQAGQVEQLVELAAEEEQADGEIVPVYATWSSGFDDEGLPTFTETPSGRRTEYAYELETADGKAAHRRSQGNLTEIVIHPDSRGPNGPLSQLVTRIEYESRTNLSVRIEDPTGSVTEIIRGKSGLPRTVREAVGTEDQTTSTFLYNGFGQLETEVRGNGALTVAYAYHESGSQTGYPRERMVDPDGKRLTTTYETDDRGNVTAVVDPRGVRHESDYNELGWLVESRAAVSGSQDGAPALGYVTKHLYDGNGNATETWEPFGIDGSQTIKTFATYGVLGEILTASREVAPGGRRIVESFGYDENGNPTIVRDGKGSETHVAYDARNIATEVRRGLGPESVATPVVEKTIFDADRMPAALVDGNQRVWPRSYDGFGRVEKILDPLQNRTEVTYDGRLDPTVRSFGSDGVLLAENTLVRDFLGREQQVEQKLWDASGQTAGVPSDPESALELVTAIEYDGLGNVTKATNPLGHSTIYQYDPAGRWIAELLEEGNSIGYELDPAGNPTEVTVHEAAPDGETSSVTATNVYDALGRRVTSIDAQQNRTEWTFDAQGNVRAVLDPAGDTVTAQYDGLGRLASRSLEEGVSLSYSWDDASRLESLTDAHDRSTAYAHDAVGRLLAVTYPDGTSLRYEEYDGVGNPLRMVEPRGSQIVQVFDGAGRLRSRTITPAAGVGGVTSEQFDVDGLGRVTGAQSGAILTRFAYNSLGHLVSDETEGKAVGYRWDGAGNLVGQSYPSGQEIVRSFDRLENLRSLGPSEGPAWAIFAYQGPSLVAERSFGNGVTASSSFDDSRRLVGQVARSAVGTVFDERVSWTPNHLKASSLRGDLNDRGQLFSSDGARRLRGLAVADDLSPVANNQSIGLDAILGFSNRTTFDVDEAQNLLSATETRHSVGETTVYPDDGTGRHRPASVNGKTLVWDAAGNLVRKGDLTFRYDYKNRLVRVDRQGVGEIAKYEYDALDRRVYRTVEGVELRTVWDGWRPVEDYADGAITGRRTYGLGLDEIVAMELDVDGDGTLEGPYTPLYDSSGNLSVLTGIFGQVVERYEHGAYGPGNAAVDSVAPQVTQTRVRGNGLVIEWTEELFEENLAIGVEEGRIRIRVDGVDMTPDAFEEPPSAPLVLPSGSYGALAQADVSAGSGSGIVLRQPFGEGPRARKRLVLDFAEPPVPGSQVEVVFEPGVTRDLFGNSPSEAVSLDLTWPDADQVLSDTVAPWVEEVLVVEGRVEVELSEPPDSTTVAGLTVDGQSLTWEPCRDGYGLCSVETLEPGSYTLTIDGTLTDLAGNPLATSTQGSSMVGGGVRSAAGQSTVFQVLLELVDTLTQIAFERPDPRLVERSAVGNVYGWHGLPVDPETGLVYARNRYYDPEMGRFISTDPLGYVDGPNLYQYGLNNPVNFSDPMGTCVGPLRSAPQCQARAELIRWIFQGTPQAEIEADQREFHLNHKRAFIQAHGRRPEAGEFLTEQGDRVLLGNGEWVDKSGRIEADHAEWVVVGGGLGARSAYTAARQGGAGLFRATASGIGGGLDELASELTIVNPSAAGRLAIRALPRIRYGALDILGRPTGVRATITQEMLGTGTPANSSIIPPGWSGNGRLHNESRGHLLARLLGGSGDLPENLVTLQQKWANSPVMSGFEEQIARAIRAGQTVEFSSLPLYRGNNLVPRGITLSARGSAGFQLDVTIINPPGL